MTLKYKRNCWISNVDYLVREDRLERIIINFIIKQLNDKNKNMQPFWGCITFYIICMILTKTTT